MAEWTTLQAHLDLDAAQVGMAVAGGQDLARGIHGDHHPRAVQLTLGRGFHSSGRSQERHEAVQMLHEGMSG